MNSRALNALGVAAAVLVATGTALLATDATAGTCNSHSYAIDSPAAGATVSGTVTLAAHRTAEATGSGVADFTVDGTVVAGTTYTSTGGYTGSWDSSQAGDGSHTIGLVYRATSGSGVGDCPAGTAAADPVTVSVSNGPPATLDQQTLTAAGSTATATATSTSPSGAALTTTITGGSATVGWYAGAPSSPSLVTASGSYFDVWADPAATPSQITLTVPAAGANALSWYDTATGKWVPVVGVTGTDGSLTVTLSASSVPSIADLTGTAFALVALPAGDISVACATAGGPGFADMAGDVHAAAASCLAAYGIAKGTGATTFAPTATVTRAQVAEFLARLLAKAGVTLPAVSSSPFADVPLDVAHATAVVQLAELGVVKGTSADRFNPGGTVSRAQMASLLVRALEKASGTALTAAGTRFGDVAGDVHAGDIAKLATAGIAQGVTATQFAPNRAVLRDQMATFLARGLSRLVASGSVPLLR